MDFTNDDVILGMSQRADGPMKFSLANRLLFFKNKGLAERIIVSAGLVHQNKVVKIDNILENTIIPDCDALITNQSNLLLTVTVSDCLPIYFYDKVKKIVAIAHAGWRGVQMEIAKEVINSFVDNYHSDRADIQVFVGPHIHDCHFEVKNDVSPYFPGETVIREGKLYVDLSSAVKKQLLASSISANHINISSECTHCLSDKYFSFRRDNPQDLETMISYIGLK